MRYGIIKDGLVVNVIEADEEYAAKIGAVVMPEGSGKGDTYADGAFTKKNREKKVILMFSKMTQEEKDNLLYTLAHAAGIVE